MDFLFYLLFGARGGAQGLVQTEPALLGLPLIRAHPEICSLSCLTTLQCPLTPLSRLVFMWQAFLLFTRVSPTLSPGGYILQRKGVTSFGNTFLTLSSYSLPSPASSPCFLWHAFLTPVSSLYRLFAWLSHELPEWELCSVHCCVSVVLTAFGTFSKNVNRSRADRCICN